MKKRYKIRLPKGMVVKNDAHVDITDDCIYVEAELVKEQKYEPKNGDFIFVKVKLTASTTDSIVGIYNGINIDKIFNNTYSIYWMYAALHLTYGHKLSCPSFEIPKSIVELRPATEEEKKMLLDKLAENGKKWNAETKGIEEIRWCPKYGDVFYYVDCYGDVKKEFRIGYVSPLDNCNELFDANDCMMLYNAGNNFKTREAAEKVAEQIKEIFKNSKAE